jgi:hypothetical protein
MRRFMEWRSAGLGFAVKKPMLKPLMIAAFAAALALPAFADDTTQIQNADGTTTETSHDTSKNPLTGTTTTTRETETKDAQGHTRSRSKRKTKRDKQGHMKERSKKSESTGAR